ncbi:hypothetical protein RJT34_16303 [Clitoria ternatea]|uniref:Uncharacterized protein n=1 Tax=Clitoria ternatea TaxID=43366 RepID=A0AAN9J762_CLITE
MKYKELKYELVGDDNESPYGPMPSDSAANGAYTQNKCDLSRDDLIKLVVEKKELLKLKNKDIEKLHDKVLHTHAEIENILYKARCEVENSKKFHIQVATVAAVEEKFEKLISFCSVVRL